MLHIINRLSELFARYQNLLLPMGVVCSLALCFLGFKYLKGWVAAFAFMIGVGGGFFVSYGMTGESMYAPFMIGLLTGLVLMLVSFLAFKIGIFSLTAFLVGEAIWSLPLMDCLAYRIRIMDWPGSMGDKLASFIPILLSVVIGVVIGYAALKMTRKIIIVATGCTGAYRAVVYFAKITDTELFGENRFVWISVIILLALLGMVVQFFTTKE